MQRPLVILSYLLDVYLKMHNQEKALDRAHRIFRDMFYNGEKLDWDETEQFYQGLSEIRAFPFILDDIKEYTFFSDYKRTNEFKYYKKIIDKYMTNYAKEAQ